MEKKTIKMDQEGFRKYQLQIEKLENKLAEIRKYKGETAIFQGDTWHDNPELYQIEAKERSLMLEIAKYKGSLNDIEIIDKRDSANLVSIGDKLKIEIYDGTDIEELIIVLVGGVADLTNDIEEVSINSPLGLAIYEKKINDKIKYSVNEKEFEVTIKEKLN